MAPPLLRRFLEDAVREALADTPVVAVNGAHQVGTRTLVAQVTTDLGGQIVILDDRANVTPPSPIQTASSMDDRTRSSSMRSSASPI